MSLGLSLSMEIDGDALKPRDLGAVHRAIEAAAAELAELARGIWIREARQLQGRGAEVYLRGLTEGGEVRTVSTGGPEVVVEVANTAPHADILDHGRPRFSLDERRNVPPPMLTQPGQPSRPSTPSAAPPDRRRPSIHESSPGGRPLGGGYDLSARAAAWRAPARTGFGLADKVADHLNHNAAGEVDALYGRHILAALGEGP